MEPHDPWRADRVEFTRSVLELRATWAITARLTSEILELTAAGFRAIHLAQAQVYRRAGRCKLRMTAS